MADLTKKTIRFIYERDNGICQICFLPTGEGDWNIDHIIPRSFGGSNRYTNLRLTHYECNHKRADDMTNAEKNKLLSDQYERQDGKCWCCLQPLKFSMVNKIAFDYRLPVSWDNMVLAHRHCRAEYNRNVVEPWRVEMRKIKGECIRKILGID